jgi:hypothetical protein
MEEGESEFVGKLIRSKIAVQQASVLADGTVSCAFIHTAIT